MFQRIIKTLTFRSNGSELHKSPDLFNPLWINVTLAFTLSVIGNLSAFMHSKTEFHFRFEVVQHAFSLVFGLGILVPALITLSFWVYGIKQTITSTIGIVAIYNYSNLFFIIGSFFYLIPIKLVGFLFLLFFALVSALSLIQNYSGFIDQCNEGKKKFVIILVIAFQALAMLAYKFGFFT